jgi:hypothetical protein
MGLLRTSIAYLGSKRPMFCQPRDVRRTSRFLLGTLPALCLLLAQGCQKPAEAPPEVTIRHEVSPRPPRVGPATVTLTMTDAGGEPVTGAQIQVEGNMLHAGMKPVFGDAKEVQPGRYEAPLEFTMGGDWFLLVNATLPDGGKIERQLDLPGVQSR